MTKLRPGHHCFLLQIDSCVLIESPLSDPHEALDQFLNNPASKPVTIVFTDATSNRAASRRVKLLPFASGSQSHCQQQGSSDGHQQGAPQQNKIIYLDQHRRSRRNNPA